MQGRLIRQIVLIVVPALIVSLSCFAQMNTIEILKKNLAAAEHDTLRVDFMNQLGKYYAAQDARQALKYLNEAMGISQTSNYRKGIAYSYLYLGRVHYYSDDYQSTYSYFYKAFPILSEIDNKEGLAEYYFFLGSVDHLLGDYESALQDFQQAIEMYELLGDQRGISIILNSIGKIHSDQGNSEMALQYLNRSLSMKREMNDLAGEATVLNNIGGLHEKQDENEIALGFYKQALEIRIDVGDQRRIANSLHRVGDLYCKSGQFEQAETNFTKALEVFSLVKDQTGITVLNVSLAKLYLKWGKYDMAMEYAETAVRLARIIQNEYLVSHCLELMSEVEAADGNYVKAFELHKEFKQISDSIFNRENERTIADMEVKYQTYKKDEAITQLSTENKDQEQKLTLLTISLIALAVLILLVFWMLRFRTLSLRRKNELLANEKILRNKENQLKEQENRMLAEKIEQQNKDLISKALLINKSNETTHEIAASLKQIKIQLGNGSKKSRQDIDSIIHQLEHFSSTNLWEDFELAFKDVHSSFYKNLLQACPDLTPSEIKTAALLRLNLSTKEIEAITFKSESSIKSIRHRMRKKLGLDNDANLTAFLMKL